jgi:hypothetical protein
MSAMVISVVVVLIAVALFWPPTAFGAETMPTVSNLVVAAGADGARVSFGLYPKMGVADVWICWGTEDAGASLIEWQHVSGWTNVVGGACDLPVGPLEPDTSYCFRVMAANRGGKTLSDPVWARTGKLYPIGKQAGTVVAVK